MLSDARKMFVIGILLFSLYAVFGQEEGEPCFHNGARGTCVVFGNCPSARLDLINKIIPKTCGYSGIDSIVCCVSKDAATTQRNPVATTPKMRWTTPRYTPTLPVYTDENGGSAKTCLPIPPEQTSKRTGRKAWDKCIEYQETLLYPCKRSVALVNGVLERDDNCMHNAEELIVGGEDADVGEFPHMVALGHGTHIPTIVWGCGGTLLSEKFILTAGHCTVNRENVTVSYALINILNRTETENVDISKLFKILNVIKHPQYKAPLTYHDIALLETEKTMPLTPFTVPACLHVGDIVDDSKALATGWGLTEYKGKHSNTLQKVIVEQFSQEECKELNPVHKRHLNRGYDVNTQMCYGHKTQSKDTCEGDSGGPLQIKSKSMYCTYTVIGVTSFGKGCGFSDNPGVYTRVAAYVPWIESVVWPDP